MTYDSLEIYAALSMRAADVIDAAILSLIALNLVVLLCRALGRTGSSPVDHLPAE